MNYSLVNFYYQHMRVKLGVSKQQIATEPLKGVQFEIVKAIYHIQSLRDCPMILLFTPSFTRIC